VPLRCTSPCRSSAETARETVLLGSPAASASPPTLLESSFSTTRTSSWAARSIAWVPVCIAFRPIMWNDCSTLKILGSARMFVNKMPRYEILSDEAMDTLDRGWRRIVSEIGVEFVLPEAVDVFAKAGQTVEGQNVKLDPDFVMEQVRKAPSEF